MKGAKLGAMGQSDMKAALTKSTNAMAAVESEDEALLASGENLRTLAQIAKALGVAKGDLLAIVAPLPTVRYLTSETPYRYCEKDVFDAIQPHLDRLKASFAGEQARKAAKKATTPEK